MFFKNHGKILNPKKYMDNLIWKTIKLGVNLLWGSLDLDNGLFCPSKPIGSIAKVLSVSIKKIGKHYAEILDPKKSLDYRT